MDCTHSWYNGRGVDWFAVFEEMIFIAVRFMVWKFLGLKRDIFEI